MLDEGFESDPMLSGRSPLISESSDCSDTVMIIEEPAETKDTGDVTSCRLDFSPAECTRDSKSYKNIIMQEILQADSSLV